MCGNEIGAARKKNNARVPIHIFAATHFLISPPVCSDHPTAQVLDRIRKLADNCTGRTQENQSVCR